ncbi:MAG: T9SS type A sorting domain-containing protein [Bacteroidia bacterium]|jgi:hypothetical protein
MLRLINIQHIQKILLLVALVCFSFPGRAQQTNPDETNNPENSIQFPATPAKNHLAAENDLKLQVFPNPAADYTTATVFVSVPDQLNLVLVDIAGKVVIELPQIEVKRGEYTFDFNTAGLKQGVYFISLTGQSTRLVQKLQVE